MNHLPDLFVVILNSMVGFCPVDDQAASVLDVLEGLEAAMKIADKLGKFISSSLADMAFVDDEH